MIPNGTASRESTFADPRVSTAIVWAGGVLAVFFTSMMIWLSAGMVQIKADIAVLLARPEGVSREEYMRNEVRRDADDSRRDTNIDRNLRDIEALAKSEALARTRENEREQERRK